MLSINIPAQKTLEREKKMFNLKGHIAQEQMGINCL